ncbi:MAG: NAD(P)-binding domain-containing protein, partial [Myxococcaceae bacterium]
MTVELDWEVLTIAFFVVSSVVLTWVLRLRHLGREANSKKALAQAISKNLHIPQTLHPVVDPDLCIGSLSCIKACPEGDILGVVDGRAVLINASACIGHGKCELECPVDAIKLVFGSSERGQDLPRVDEYFESSRQGVYIVGELGGMGLIKNALQQGLQVGKHLSVKLKGQARKAGGDLVDIAIVGAGAAGLAAALACKEEGLSFRVLEQDSVGGTIAHYPRQKLVMTERVDLPLVGKFGKKIISKEELLGAWKKIVEKAQIRVEQGVKVEHIHGDDGAFKVATNRGDVKARKIVLAIGRRGTPRKLGVKGEDSAKVSYRLVDP